MMVFKKSPSPHRSGRLVAVALLSSASMYMGMAAYGTHTQASWFDFLNLMENSDIPPTQETENLEGDTGEPTSLDADDAAAPNREPTVPQPEGDHCSTTLRYDREGNYIRCIVIVNGRTNEYENSPRGLTELGCQTFCDRFRPNPGEPLPPGIPIVPGEKMPPDPATSPADPVSDEGGTEPNVVSTGLPNQDDCNAQLDDVIRNWSDSQKSAVRTLVTGAGTLTTETVANLIMLLQQLPNIPLSDVVKAMDCVENDNQGVCGDGIVDPETEDCDDGNSDDGESVSTGSSEEDALQEASLHDANGGCSQTGTAMCSTSTACSPGYACQLGGFPIFRTCRCVLVRRCDSITDLQMCGMGGCPSGCSCRNGAYSHCSCYNDISGDGC